MLPGHQIPRAGARQDDTRTIRVNEWTTWRIPQEDFDTLEWLVENDTPRPYRMSFTRQESSATTRTTQ